MRYVIYIDVFFFVNLVMDFLILKLAALYIKPQTTFIRCMLGAVCGSALSAISLLISYENMILHMFFSYIFIAIAMVYTTFGRCGLKDIVKRSVVLYMITIFMGGVINFIYSYTYMGYILQQILVGMRRGINILWIIIATAVAYICLDALVCFFRRNKLSNMKVMVRLSFKDKTKIIPGLIDSGNNLYEPYTGKAVHIVQISSINELLEGVDITMEKFKLVPFSSLGKKHGLIRVISFEELCVYNEESNLQDTEDIIYVEKDAAVGLYDECLSKTGEFQILLHRIVSV